MIAQSACLALVPVPCLQLKLHNCCCLQAHLEREFEEVKRQLEEDADREIEDMKDKYEQR